MKQKNINYLKISILRQFVCIAVTVKSVLIKLCLRGAATCVLSLF